MNQQQPSQRYVPVGKPSRFFWCALGLLLILIFILVTLFGGLLYLFINGAQQRGWSTTAYAVIFVFISGVFAWLIKRLSDVASEMSDRWFPGQPDEMKDDQSA